MNRKNIFNNGKKIKIGTLILFYVLILSCLILSITIARYQTTLKNIADLDTAKWIFKLSYNNAEITSTEYNIDLKDTITSNSSNIAENYIAPSTEGQIPLQIDCTNCEVGVKYILKITDINSTLPSQLKFYTSSDYNSSSEILLNTEYSTDLDISQIDTVQSKNIYWKWLTTDENMINQDDISKSGTTMLINIKITGQEMISSN